MAYEKFIPELWSEAIQRELEGNYVFVEDCNRQWEGDVKKKGDTVHILGVGKPSVKDIAFKDGDGNRTTNATIDDPEEIEGNEVILVIDKINYFNYMVGDIDKAQAIGGLMDALSKETSEALADKVDKYIADFAVDSSVEKLTSDAQEVTKENILGILDSAIQRLYEHNVKSSTEVVVTVSPRFYTLFKQAYINADTNNSAMLKNGKVGMYGNVTVKMSNNVKKTKSSTDATTDDVDNIMIRTKRAIAFAQPLTHTEAYRPEKKFADAVKGFILYGAEVVRPEEIININVKYA